MSDTFNSSQTESSEASVDGLSAASRSPLTQELLNYFDETDVRTREVPWTIEAQLLNAVAVSLDESDLRISREIQARRLHRVPLNLDHGGLWQQVQLPPSVVSPEPVIGVRGGVPVPLTLYDEFLPVPSAVELDPARASAVLADPVLASVVGTGLPWSSGPLSLAVPNRLLFWLEGLGDFAGAVDIEISGYPHPRAYWVSAADPMVEKVTLLDEGPAETVRTWESIENVAVRGLPQGAALRICLFGFAFPCQPDPLRPFAHPAYRDVRYPRLWGVEGGLVKEMAFMGRFAGYEPINTYFSDPGVVSLAVEPNTYGLLAAVPGAILYADRRQPVPDNLYRSALTEEPLYGLEVAYESTLSGDLRSITLRPIAYAGADRLTEYRLTAEMPDGTIWIVTPRGDLARFGNSGFRRGVPGDVILSLSNSQLGTWWFTLETLDQTGHKTEDRQPYLNAGFVPAAALDVTTLVPSLEGLGFDSRQRLWLWSGDFLVPVRFRYDAYLYDEGGRCLYLTDAYDEVQLG